MARLNAKQKRALTDILNESYAGIRDDFRGLIEDGVKSLGNLKFKPREENDPWRDTVHSLATMANRMKESYTGNDNQKLFSAVMNSAQFLPASERRGHPTSERMEYIGVVSEAIEMDGITEPEYQLVPIFTDRILEPLMEQGTQKGIREARDYLIRLQSLIETKPADELISIEKCIGSRHELDIDVIKTLSSTVSDGPYIAASGLINDYGVVSVTGEVAIGSKTPISLRAKLDGVERDYEFRFEHDGIPRETAILLYETKIQLGTRQRAPLSVSAINRSLKLGVSVTGVVQDLIHAYGVTGVEGDLREGSQKPVTLMTRNGTGPVKLQYQEEDGLPVIHAPLLQQLKVLAPQAEHSA